MRWIAAAALVLLPLASPAAERRPAVPGGDAASPAPDRCDRFGRVERTGEAGSARAQRLDQLPPADLSLAVMRSVNGCPEPVVIRENIGAAPFQPEKRPAARPGRPRLRLLDRR